MEKISFPPLIQELNHHSALYNQWYNDHEMKYGNMPSQTIAIWMVKVVEPIVKATFSINSTSEKMHEVVKALYLESLKLIGSGLAIRYNNDYKMVWLLLEKMPNLVLKFPIKTISLLNDVLVNLHNYASEKTTEWCNLMETSSIAIKTIEEFKIIGRIYAWKCGLAHLRTRLKADFEQLSENLQQTIITNLGSDKKNSTQIFENPWSSAITEFKGVQGGFEGTTSFFKHPPKLAQLGEHIFVSDTIDSYAFFADQFGDILMPANTVDSTAILSNSKQAKNLTQWLGKNYAKIESQNISSIVATKNTLVFTLQNSYFLYIYSLGNA